MFRMICNGRLGHRGSRIFSSNFEVLANVTCTPYSGPLSPIIISQRQIFRRIRPGTLYRSIRTISCGATCLATAAETRSLLAAWVFGYASVWLPYAIYLSQLGYPCYALSLRGHGANWVPGIVKLWWTTKAVFTRDTIAGIEWATMEETRKQDGRTALVSSV
jgi:hypothetical protein